MSKSKSYWCRLYIAGDASAAALECGRFCREIGWCVTVSPTKYVYSGGQEEGVVIEAINYPRFPARKVDIRNRVVDLAHRLAKSLNQRSFTISDPDRSEFFSLSMPFLETRT